MSDCSQAVSLCKKNLEKSGLTGCNPVSYLMESKLKLAKDEEGVPCDPTEFRSIIGGLRYLTHTRPHISFAVGIVSRYMERPTILHKQALKHILRYVQGTINYGVVYEKNEDEPTIMRYSYSDLAGVFDDKKSTTGMVFYVNGSLITWASQKQKV